MTSKYICSLCMYTISHISIANCKHNMSRCFTFEKQTTSNFIDNCVEKSFVCSAHAQKNKKCPAMSSRAKGELSAHLPHSTLAAETDPMGGFFSPLVRVAQVRVAHWVAETCEAVEDRIFWGNQTVPVDLLHTSTP